MTGASRRSAHGRIKSSSSSSSGGDSLRYPPSIRRGGKGKELVSIGAFKSNLKILVGLMLLGIAIIYFVINRIVVSHESQKPPRVITPFPAPKLMDLSMVYTPILYWRFVPLLVRGRNWIESYMCVTSSRASTRRAYTGERIVLMFILEFVRGKEESYGSCFMWTLAPYCGTFMEMQNSTVTCSWIDVAWC